MKRRRSSAGLVIKRARTTGTEQLYSSYSARKWEEAELTIPTVGGGSLVLPRRWRPTEPAQMPSPSSGLLPIVLAPHPRPKPGPVVPVEPSKKSTKKSKSTKEKKEKKEKANKSKAEEKEEGSTASAASKVPSTQPSPPATAASAES